MKQFAILNVASFLDAAAEIPTRVPLSRLWSSDEVIWQCGSREGSVFAQLQDGGWTGTIAGYIMPIANKDSTQCVFVDDVLWDGFGPDQQLALLDAFLNRCSGSAHIVVVPILGYTSHEIFTQRGFRRFPRSLQAYLTLWNPGRLANLQGMYMDVL